MTFDVTNLSELGAAHQLHGYRIDPACKATTVVLLQHGLSYTSEAWDFPGYSWARALAAHGYAVVAIDRLGYGQSKLADGRNVSVEAYGDMAHQVVLQLHKEFAHVVVGGHSAGAEAAEEEAGLYGGVDALVTLAYHPYPSPQLLEDFFTGDYPRALSSDYEYFLGTPKHRADMFFTADADPAVVAADQVAAVPTPSGEILTIGPQPSREIAALVKVPVFLQLAAGDRLFPASYASLAAALFVGAPSVTTDIVADAGHTFMLHPSGRAAVEGLAAWLAAQKGTPPCQPDTPTATVEAAPVSTPAAPPAAVATTVVAGRELAATGGRPTVAAPVLLAIGLVAALVRRGAASASSPSNGG